jgi:hypothetical protein
LIEIGITAFRIHIRDGVYTPFFYTIKEAEQMQIMMKKVLENFTTLEPFKYDGEPIELGTSVVSLEDFDKILRIDLGESLDEILQKLRGKIISKKVGIS